MKCITCGSWSVSYDPVADSYDCRYCGDRFTSRQAEAHYSKGLTYQSLQAAMQQLMCQPATPKPEPPKLNDDPVLYAEPIVGWRLWHAESGRLRSGYPYVEWIPKEPLKAEHQNRGWAHVPYVPCTDSPCEPHEPDEAPGCGIYALKSPIILVREGYHLNPGFVIGTVYLWGRIFEHQDGYRAQYAYPASFVHTGSSVDLDALAALYNVPTDKENSTWKSVYRPAASSPSLYSSRNLLGSPMIWFSPIYYPPNLSSIPKLSLPSPYGSRDDEEDDKKTFKNLYKRLIGGKS